MSNLKDYLDVIKFKYIKLKSNIVNLNNIIEYLENSGGRVGNLKSHLLLYGKVLCICCPNHRYYGTIVSRIATLEYTEVYNTSVFTMHLENDSLVIGFEILDYDKTWWFSYE